jgi:KilA-N domain
MLTKFVSKDYRGGRIRINPTSKFVCLTDICKASGKKFFDWYRQKDTQPFLNVLSLEAGIPASNLLIVGKGKTLTWGHPQVAIDLASWCSVEMRVKITGWIFELLSTGKVDLGSTHTLPVIIDQNDVERGVQFGKAAALRPFETEKLPVPDGWLTVREHLIEIVGESDTVRQSGASYWICRNTADSYRSNTSGNPPQASNSRGGTFCYPAEYRDAIAAEWKSYRETHHEQMEQIAREQAKAHKQCNLFDLFPDIEAA